MATNTAQRTKKEKKQVRFADTVVSRKDKDVSVENTRVVHIGDEQHEQVDDIVQQLDQLHLEALRCMDVHCEANEWRLNMYNVRADAFDRLLQIVPAVSATVELDHAQVHLQTLFNEIANKWRLKMRQIDAQLNEFIDDSNHVIDLLDVNNSVMAATVSSCMSNLETAVN